MSVIVDARIKIIATIGYSLKCRSISHFGTNPIKGGIPLMDKIFRIMGIEFKCLIDIFDWVRLKFFNIK